VYQAWCCMGRTKHKAPNASDLFKEYDSGITSRTAQASRNKLENSSNKDPYCICCKSTSVLIFTNTVTFVLSLGLIIVGAFINNEIKGWELRTFDIIGNLVLGMGFFVAVVSIVGIFAGRTNARMLLFIYFMAILLVSYLLLLVVVWALLEGDDVAELLDRHSNSSEGHTSHWEHIQKVVGTDASREDVTEILQDYMYATSAVGLAGLLMLLCALVSTVRLLGLRAIAYSCLVTLAVVGGACIYAGVTSRGEIPSATSWLLFACGAVQCIVALCGLAGFKNLNRECMRWFFIVLVLACAGLVYVIVSSYQHLRNASHDMDHPENLMLVFGIALVSDFFMLITGVSGWLFYCKQKGAFAAADKAALGTIHFSNHDKKYGKKGRGRKRGAREHSCNVRNAL